MIVKNEVKLHQESVDYLDIIFKQYAVTDKLPKIVENPIIHMYPFEDTYAENGELEGYIDAIFFKVHIYDPVNAIVYKSETLHDGILPLEDLPVSQIKIFKDLSTLVALHGKFSFGFHTALSVYKEI